MANEHEIRMMAVCRTLNPGGQVAFLDEFDVPSGAMDSAQWSHVSGPAWTLDGETSTGLPIVASGSAKTDTNPTPQVRTALLADKTPSKITYREAVLRLKTAAGAIEPSIDASILMDMNDATPVPTGSIRLRALRLTSSANRALSLFVNNASVQTVVNQTGIGTWDNLRLSIDALGTVRGYWQNNTTPMLTYPLAPYTAAGGRVGFALARSSQVNLTIVHSFTLNYVSVAGAQPPEMLMASAAGKLYRESTLGKMVEVIDSPQLTLRSDKLLSAANRLQKLFIADYQLRKAGTATGASTTTTFTDGATDWVALGVNANDDLLEIISGSPGTGNPPVPQPGFYRIATVNAGSLILATSPGASASAITYRVTRGPKIYDAETDNMTLVGNGTIGVSQFPAGFRSICLWDDRLVLSNHADTPQLSVMSAKGYPLLWDFGDSGTVNAEGGTPTVPLPAIAGLGVNAATLLSSAESAGMLAEPIVTAVPISDDLLIYACRGAFYVLRGNPLLGGVLSNISRDIGIVDIAAWCRTPDGRLFAMTPDGLYRIALERAIPVSRDVIPQELIGLSDANYEISMTYDVTRRGILILASGKQFSTPSISYFYEERTEAFFPYHREMFDHDPTAAVSHQPAGTTIPTVMLGCRDGYIRKFDDVAQNDDGVNFNSRVFYGPLRLGAGEWGDGVLYEIVCVLDVLSGNVTLNVRGGHSAQSAKSATPRYTTSMAAGRNRNRYPRLRYGVVYVEIVGTPGSRWAMESLTVTRESVGRLSVV